MTSRGPDAAGTGGLLAVHAHPDDETLATGALLAAWADAGRPVTVVTCTRGELGEVIGAELAHLAGDGRALAAHRETELAHALAELGITDHLFLDEVSPGVLAGDGGRARYADSGMAWAGVGRAGPGATRPADAFVASPLDPAARRLARVLRDRRPDVVVTYEPGGGYGHPDHVRAHQVTTAALALAADPGVDLGRGVADVPADVAAHLPAHVPAAVLWAVVAEDDLRRAYRALPGLPAVAALLAAHPELTLPDPDGPLPSVAVPAAEVDVAVDVAPVLVRVVAALAAHASQVRAVTRTAGPAVVGCYALSNDVLAPLLGRESYRRAPDAGPGGRADRRRDVDWPAAVRPVP